MGGLIDLHGGPEMAPKPPDARRAPAKPWRSSKFSNRVPWIVGARAGLSNGRRGVAEPCTLPLFHTFPLTSRASAEFRRDHDPDRKGAVALMKVEVFDNQIEAALKTLKKQMLKGGVFQEMKRRAFYEKPSVKRKRKPAQAGKKRRRAMQRSRREED